MLRTTLRTLPKHRILSNTTAATTARLAVKPLACVNVKRLQSTLVGNQQLEEVEDLQQEQQQQQHIQQNNVNNNNNIPLNGKKTLNTQLGMQY